jgi:hypothetical protein
LTNIVSGITAHSNIGAWASQRETPRVLEADSS